MRGGLTCVMFSQFLSHRQRVGPGIGIEQCVWVRLMLSDNTNAHTTCKLPVGVPCTVVAEPTLP